jgi:hypothetical protein
MLADRVFFSHKVPAAGNDIRAGPGANVASTCVEIVFELAILSHSLIGTLEITDRFHSGSESSVADRLGHWDEDATGQI